MKVFFTSDLHLQSPDGGIIQWAHRPFKNVLKHDEAMIRGINSRCKSDDLLVHVGDFMNYGRNHGIESGRNSFKSYRSQINCQVVFLLGNHDANNGVKTVGKTLVSNIGRYRVTVGHYPSWDERFDDVNIPNGMGFRIHLCGHVHDAWKYKFDYDRRILNVNVGVDAWKYHPVSENELEAFINSILILS